MRKVKDQVEEVLSYSRQARNSDKELLLQFMQNSGMNLSLVQMEKFRNMPSSETIRRIRQKLQEGGKYVADQKIKRERNYRSYAMQQQMPQAKPEQVEQILTQRAIPWLDEEN